MSEPMSLQDVLVTCLISSYFDRRAWGSLVEKAINGELEELEEPRLCLLHLSGVLDVLPTHLVDIVFIFQIFIFIYVLNIYRGENSFPVHVVYCICMQGYRECV